VSRVTPFDLVFGELAEEKFPALTSSLAKAGIDPVDRDAFTLDGAVTEFLRELVPEDAPTESLQEFIAVLQHSHLFWCEGKQIIVGGTSLPTNTPSAHAPTRPCAYVQLPDHLYWGQLEPDAPHEPLDGCFVHPFGDGLRVLGVFGLHPQRPGFSVAEFSGRPDRELPARPDGTDPFAPLMDGGAAAGIRSIYGGEELMVLAWHALPSGA
jgi:hypothetical protein